MRIPSEEEIQSVKDEISTLYQMPKFPGDEAALNRYARVIAQFASASPEQHPTLGRVVPIEWLIDQVCATFTFFPSPIQMRQTYEQAFPPLDGLSSAQLLERIE